ncbi:MAG: hypothetical protein IH946_04535 [Bacteroidetes bacterium]|nr:hypothetical protein [Bacteroidota bacterium]
MKIGDEVENAIWITGDESQELRKRYERDVIGSIDFLCLEMGFFHGPVTFIEKRPGEDKVPPVPDHIQGQRVRLLIAEAIVTKKRPTTSKGSFVANLELKDLKELRKITRKAYAKSYGTLIGNTKCDEIIEALGPDAAVATLETYH